jgi:hypothetical protein
MTTAAFRIGIVAAVALIGCAADVLAQNEVVCAAVMKARAQPESTRACNALAVYIYTQLTTAEVDAILKPESIRAGDIFSQRDLQNKSAQHPELTGTPAQGQAVPGVQPAGVAAGTIAAVGTNAGQDAIAALSINPAVLFVAEEASEQLARLSRVADITVFLPVSGLTDDTAAKTGQGKIRYFGARVRLNFTGVSSGSQIWNKVDELMRQRIIANARGAGRILGVLTKTADVKGCTDAFLDNRNNAAVIAACGASAEFTPDLALAARLRQELTTVRRAADARYFGADIRMDVGDPTLGEVANARGQFLFAGIAVGRRFNPASSTNSGVRARIGLRHAKLDTDATAEFAVEGAGGIELARSIGDDELNLSAGIEFRYGNAPAAATDRFQTDFAMVRGSLIVPITTGNSLSINVGAPIAGNVSPMFSVNFNWGLLLSNQVGQH